ncbi:MAG: YceI family protein [Leptospira sp.]|nr:YceI family protein [Leptospira sp.]
MNKLGIFLMISVIFLAHNSISAQEKCLYSYDPSQTTLEWTAFKFTEKTGVKGTMRSIIVKETKKAKTPLDAVKNLNFKIRTDSVDSNNPGRDEKIKQFFFGSVAKNEFIQGRFTQITGAESGKALLNLEFNGKKQTFPVTYTIVDETVEVVGTIDVLKIGLGNGLQKLNEACIELHKGTDGKSKLWPTVDIKVVSKLAKECAS